MGGNGKRGMSAGRVGLPEWQYKPQSGLEGGLWRFMVWHRGRARVGSAGQTGGQL